MNNIENPLESLNSENKEPLFDNGIIICNKIHEWANPASHPGTKMIYVEDLINGDAFSTSEMTWAISTVVKKIKDDQGNLRSLIFDNEKLGSGYTTYGDGYFGRPLIPCGFYSLHPLRVEQIEEIKSILLEQGIVLDS